MVKLFVSNLDQMTILEYLLFINNIDHTIELHDGRFGMTAPYLLVYGVPLDEKRAFAWIRGQRQEEYCE